jgi:hypothetical protein
MKAKLNITRKGNGDLHYRIQSGEKGTGKTLWECTSWDNPHATEQADTWAKQYAKQHGLSLTPWDEE